MPPPLPPLLAPVALAVGALAVGALAVSPVSAPTARISPPRSLASAPSAAAVGVPPRPPARPQPRGRFRWPLSPAPRVLRRFAVGPQPWSPGHRGVDLAATPGRAVLAAGAGVVAFADRVAGVGVVVVDHGGGLRTTYEPVEASVHPGAAAAAGTPLGVLGRWPGHCPGPCLHWGALRGGVYVDPLTLLGLGPPVLLPLGGSG